MTAAPDTLKLALDALHDDDLVLACEHLDAVCEQLEGEHPEALLVVEQARDAADAQRIEDAEHHTQQAIELLVGD